MWLCRVRIYYERSCDYRNIHLETAIVETPTADYILVALDSSPHSQAALAAATELAASLHLELRGLYVEDVNLLHLYGLPFGLEFGAFTARPRRLESSQLEREFRLQATLLRKSMADVAGQRRVTWSFQVVRGGVADQLLAAGATARWVTLGRVGRTPGKRTGSTAQAVARNTQRPVLIQSTRRKMAGPFVVVHTGTAAADHALALAAELAVQHESVLNILLYGDPERTVIDLQQLPALPAEVHVHAVAELRDLLANLHAADGTVVLPVDAARWLEETRGDGDCDAVEEELLNVQKSYAPELEGHPPGTFTVSLTQMPGTLRSFVWQKFLLEKASGDERKVWVAVNEHGVA